MKKLMLFVLIFILLAVASLYYKNRNFDKAAFTGLFNKFDAEKKVNLFCYRADDDFRVNNFFYGENEAAGVHKLGFYNDSFAEISEEKVFGSTNLNYEKIKSLGKSLNDLNINCADKSGGITKFIMDGFVGSEKGVVYSPISSPEGMFDKIKPLGVGWYRYWLY